MGNLDILNSIVSFIVGLISGFTLKVVVDRSTKRTTTVNQRNNKAGRDIIGGDKKDR